MPHLLSPFAQGLEMNLNSPSSILSPTNKKAMEASPERFVKAGAKGKKKPNPDQERIQARQQKLAN